MKNVKQNYSYIINIPTLIFVLVLFVSSFTEINGATRFLRDDDDKKTTVEPQPEKPTRPEPPPPPEPPSSPIRTAGPDDYSSTSG